MLHRTKDIFNLDLIEENFTSKTIYADYLLSLGLTAGHNILFENTMSAHFRCAKLGLSTPCLDDKKYSELEIENRVELDKFIRDRVCFLNIKEKEDYWINQYKIKLYNQVDLLRSQLDYWILNKQRIITGDMKTLFFHELGHLAEANFIQCREVDFGLLSKKVNIHSFKRECIAIVYELILADNYSDEKLEQRVEDGLLIFGAKSTNRYDFDHTDEKLKIYFIEEAKKESDKTKLQIEDKIRSNVKYLKDKGYIKS